MALLKEIQAAATDGDVSIGVVLRKCLILATRLRHAGLKAWVERELNGYGEAPEDEFPPYRVADVLSAGNFAGYMQSQMRNAPIALRSLPEVVRQRFATVHLREPAAS